MKCTDKSVTSTSFSTGTNTNYQLSGTLFFTYENAAPYIENVPLQGGYLRDNSKDVHIMLSSDEAGEVYYFGSTRMEQSVTTSGTRWKKANHSAIAAGPQKLTFTNVSYDDSYLYVYVRGEHGSSNILRIEIPTWPSLHRFGFNGYSSNEYVAGLDKELEYYMNNTYYDIYFPENSDQGEVLVDGEPLVMNQDFTWTKGNGSMTIFLLPGFLDKLPWGEHTLELLSLNGRRIAETFYTRLESGYLVSVETGGGGTVSGGGHFVDGDFCTVTATPDPRYHFVRWETTNTYSTTMSTEAKYTFPVTSSIALRAVFEINKYTVSASVSPAGAGTADINGSRTKSANFYEDDPVTVSVGSTTRGYVFSHWSENGRRLTGSQEYSFTAAGDRALVANFVPREYEIRYHGLDEGMENPNPDSFTFGKGTITLRPPVPNKNSKGQSFVGWSTSPTATYRTTILGRDTTRDIDLYALWEGEGTVFNITYKGLLGGSTENLPKTYTVGKGISFLPDAKAGVDGPVFVEWREGGPDGPFIERIPAYTSGDLVLYAVFRIPITYQPAAEKQYQKLSPNGANPTSYIWGDTFTILPTSYIEETSAVINTYTNGNWNITAKYLDGNSEERVFGPLEMPQNSPVVTSDYMFFVMGQFFDTSSIVSITLQPTNWGYETHVIPYDPKPPVNEEAIVEFEDSMEDPESPLDEGYGDMLDKVTHIIDEAGDPARTRELTCCEKYKYNYHKNNWKAVSIKQGMTSAEIKAAEKNAKEGKGSREESLPKA